MKAGSLFAGVGAVAFGALLLVGMVIGNPPGGNYGVHDAAKYVAKGHRASVILSLYLVLLAVAGLVLLLARLRDSITGARLARVFWALGVASASAIASGYALVAAVPLALAYGGHGLTVTPQLTYVLAESGWVIMYGAGGILLGAALVTFAAGQVEAPAWFRRSTFVAGLAGLAAPAWCPFFLVMLWSLVAGVWLLVGGRGRRIAPEPQPA